MKKLIKILAFLLFAVAAMGQKVIITNQGGGGSTTGANGIIVSGGAANLGNAPGGTASPLTSDRIIVSSGNHLKLIGDGGGWQIGGGAGVADDALLNLIGDGTPLISIQYKGANQGTEFFSIITDTTNTVARRKDRARFRFLANPGGIFGVDDIRDYTYSFGVVPATIEANDSLSQFFGLGWESHYRPGGGGIGKGVVEWRFEHNYRTNHVSTIAGTRVIEYNGDHDGATNSLGFNANTVYLGDLEQRGSIQIYMGGNTFNSEFATVGNGMTWIWDGGGDYWPLKQRTSVGGSAFGLIKLLSSGEFVIGENGNGYTFLSNGAAKMYPGGINQSFEFGSTSRRIGSFNLYTSNIDAFTVNSSANPKLYAWEQPATGWQLRNVTDNLVSIFVKNGAPNNSVFITASGGFNVNTGDANLGRIVATGQIGTVGFRAQSMNDASGYAYYASGSVTGQAYIFGGNMSATDVLKGEIWNNSTGANAHARLDVRTSSSTGDPFIQFSAAGSADNWVAGVRNSETGDPFKIQFSSVLNLTSKGMAINSTDGAFTHIGYGSGLITGSLAFFTAVNSSGKLIERSAAQVLADIGADPSITNEGSLTITAGTSNTSVINSNTSGSNAITIAGDLNTSVSENIGTLTITVAANEPVTIRLTPIALTDSLKSVGTLGANYWQVPAQYNGWTVKSVVYAAFKASSGSGSVTVGIDLYNNAQPRAVSVANAFAASFSATDVEKVVAGGGTSLVTGQFLVPRISADTAVTHGQGLTISIVLQPI